MGTKRVGLARTQALIENLKRELSMGANTSLAGLERPIKLVTAATTLTAADSGKIIHWTHSSAHDITLPAATVGLSFTFILLAGAAAAHNIVTQTDDVIFGKVVVNSTTDDKVATQVVLKAAGKDKVFMHKTGATSGGDAGDVVTLVCAEAGYWVCNANLITTNGTPSSIATLTD